MALVNQYNPVNKYETAQAVSNSALILPSLRSVGSSSATLPQPLASGSFALPFVVVASQTSATLPQPKISGSILLPSLSTIGIAVATLPQPIVNGGFNLTLSVNGQAFATGLQILTDSKTNENQRFLSNNIKYK